MSLSEPVPCPILDSCGACSRMRLTDEQELTEKVNGVEERLRHPVTMIHRSPKSLGYRARVRLRFGPDGRLGYHRTGTHEHIPVSTCAIAAPEINERIPKLLGGPSGCTIEFRSNGECVQIDARSSNRSTQRPLRQWLTRLDTNACGIDGVSLGGKRLRGRGHLELNVGGTPHRLGPGTFYQVNLEVNEKLVERLGDWIREREPARVLDLYSGAGNLSLPLARQGIPVTMVESGKSAVANAKEFLARTGTRADIHVGDAGRYQAGEHFFDVAILDPPRAGAPGVLPQLLVTRPRAIAYVSCNPNALARDLRPALAAGYGLVGLELFDMFPQTPHVEVLALLERG